MIENGAAPGSNCAQRTQSKRRRHLSPAREPLPHTLDPKRRIRVEQNVFGSRILKQRENLFPHLAGELQLHPLLMLILGRTRKTIKSLSVSAISRNDLCANVR